jgi:uncharacterized LabA/DUF88 family protein
MAGETERIYVACDVSNLWKLCRKQYGNDARLNFQTLSEVVPASRYPAPVRQKLVAYIVTNPKQSHHAFYATLRSFGFTVRERFMRFDKAAHKPTRTDWDVGITIDALVQAKKYDTFVLVSGDGDFAPLLRQLKQWKKRTMVLTFEAGTSKHLYDAADEVKLLTEDVVFRRGMG